MNNVYIRSFNQWAMRLLFTGIIAAGIGRICLNNCSAANKESENLVKNGEFEDGLKHWQLTQQEPGAIKIQKSDFAFGSKSCRVKATQQGFNVVLQEIYFDEPGLYEVSMRVYKSKGTGQNSGWAEMARSKEKMLGLGYVRIGFGDHDQNEWKTFTQKINVKQKGEKHYFRLLVGRGNGYVLLDSVNITKGDSSLANTAFKVSRDEVYVSKEIPMPFSVLMRCFTDSKAGTSLVIELPQGIELQAIHGQPKVSSIKLDGTVKRDGMDYNRYVVDSKQTMTFLGLMGVLKLTKDIPSEKLALYYYAQEKDKRQPVQKVNIKQVTFKKGVQLKKLYIGISHFNGDRYWTRWFPDNTFAAIKDLGVNMVVPWGMYSEAFGKGIKDNGIELGRMGNFAHMKIPDSLKAVDKNGRRISQPSLCIYQSPEFKQSIQEIVDIYKKGYKWYFPDEEFFFMKDIDYSENCMKEFKKFLEQKYPDIKSVDAGIKNEKVWLDFRTDQVFKWYEALKNALDEAYRLNPQCGKPVIVGVWRYGGISEHNLDGPAKTTLHDFKKLSKVVDYIGPMLYQNWSFEKEPVTAIGDCAYGTYLSGRGNAGSFPTLTPGECHSLGDYVGNVAAADIRDAALECFMTGSKGVVYWRGIGFDGLDCNYLAELSRMLAPVEDIIYEGNPTKTVSCSNKKVRCLAIKNKNKVLVYLNNYTDKAESCNIYCKSGSKTAPGTAKIIYPENTVIELNKSLTIQPRKPVFIVIDQ